MTSTTLKGATAVMADQLGLLDSPVSTAAAAYAAYYRTLVNLREEFHRTGRYDDANAKLDEIVKLLVMRIHEERSGGPSRFSEDYLRSYAAETFGDRDRIARALRDLSREILKSPEYGNPDGTSVFGADPSLSIQPTDDAFALQVLKAVRDLAPPASDMTSTFDILNESFGHFVRDSFRNHLEDAQYMTPPEVVEAMVQMAFADIEADTSASGRLRKATTKDPFIVLDPTCGVGSFLTEALRRMLRIAHGTKRDQVYRDACIYGQDKVDRMVRLAKLNLMLFGGGGGSVWQGNSILNGSTLDDLQGRVDLILTNPPFGARYRVDEVITSETQRRFPMLRDLAYESRVPSIVDSELILLDRCLSLLRPGGRLLIVLPDSVVSGRGPLAAARRWVTAKADLLAVIELPAETFAQAGTRTKTCFAYFQRRSDESPEISSRRIFMGVCDDLGFRVVARTGATVKITEGVNELPAITAAYGATASGGRVGRGPLVASREPSAVWVEADALLNGRWTPNFYRARRLEALAGLQDLEGNGFELRTLSSIAQLASKSRRRASVPPNAKTISVLHVTQDGAINFRDVEGYAPKFPGLLCRAGDVLISKINPHIPRVCVVPKAGYPLMCSTEFEILEPQGVDPYLLAAILVAPAVQTQVECLTSGTSSSHNRIKDTELAEVLIPLPTAKSRLARSFEAIAGELRSGLEARYRAESELSHARRRLADAMAPGSAEPTSLSAARRR